ncbi:MAG: CvpA family protein [Akkermansiaceae bacterium]
MDQLTPSTLIVGIVALFTILGFLKSFVSFFFNLIALALGALAGLWAYNNGFEIAQQAITTPQPWMSTAIGFATFILTVITIRKFLAFLSGKSGEDSQTRSGGFGLPGGVFGLLMGGCFAYFMLTGVRYAGTVSELDRLTQYVSGKIDESSKEPVFAKLKQWIDSSQIGQWHQKIDFLNDPVEANAAKLAIVKKEDPEKFSQITSQQGEEYIPQAIPVDPAIQEAYDRRNFGELLRNDAIQKKLRETFTDEQLRQLDIEGALGLKK